MVHQKRFLAVHHLQAHALSVRWEHDVPFPYLLLLVSGGHCQLIRVQGLGSSILLGETLDDAAGEAFDKVAKLLGLGYPGGPLIEAEAHVTTMLLALERPYQPAASFSVCALHVLRPFCRAI
jgi:N6-L-threonylcarbamoyladenine synthase